MWPYASSSPNGHENEPFRHVHREDRAVAGPRPFDMVRSEKQSEALLRATRYEWVRPLISAHAQGHVCG